MRERERERDGGEDIESMERDGGEDIESMEREH